MRKSRWLYPCLNNGSRRRRASPGGYHLCWRRHGAGIGRQRQHAGAAPTTRGRQGCTNGPGPNGMMDTNQQYPMKGSNGQYGMMGGSSNGQSSASEQPPPVGVTQGQGGRHSKVDESRHRTTQRHSQEQGEGSWVPAKRAALQLSVHDSWHLRLLLHTPSVHVGEGFRHGVTGLSGR